MLTEMACDARLTMQLPAQQLVPENVPGFLANVHARCV